MFHNVLMTTLTPMRDTNEFQGWDNRPLSTIWPEVKQETLKDTSVKKTIKKKKRNRTMFTTDQVRMLEKVFARSRYIDVEKRKEISECLQIEQKCIKIWFQNRRMKEKKELSDSCDSSSECQVSSVESPPLKSPKPSNESDSNYIHPYTYHPDKQLQYYYYGPNNYIKTEDPQKNQSCFETSNNPVMPEYFGYNNNYNPNVFKRTDYSTQYYAPQTESHYYNTGEINSQYIIGHAHDWPANIYDTSYL